eukprot:gnl/MRDRNA2_/MRDRNA2_130434_c0_seq1.p1 gnl/MRDRNA2_/MRDRNA2_130434_c0~~gnl/MRDRNA2_/MRDRNA2_130434_c0_seq1.p1  ORF type:complete len:304 (+),score=114.64 gnl/MRDRNA2_/MRDRNA2_130434_c0_seq1:72-983(+)
MLAFGSTLLFWCGLQAASGDSSDGNAFMLTKRKAPLGRRVREEEAADKEIADGSVIGEVTKEGKWDPLDMGNQIHAHSEEQEELQQEEPPATVPPAEAEELKKAEAKYLKDQVEESLKTLSVMEKDLEKEVDEAVHLAENLDLKEEQNQVKLDDALAKVERSKEELANFKKSHVNLAEQVQQLKDEERRKAMEKMEEEMNREKMVKILERSKLLIVTEKEAALKKKRLEEQSKKLDELENKMKKLKKKWKVEDFDSTCPQKAAEGQCESNSQYMRQHCRKSCNMTHSEEMETMMGATTTAKEL